MNPANTTNPTTSYPTKLPGLRGNSLSEVYETSRSVAFSLPAPESYPAAYCAVAYRNSDGASSGSGMLYLPSVAASPILAGVSNIGTGTPGPVNLQCTNVSGAITITPGGDFTIRVTRII